MFQIGDDVYVRYSPGPTWCNYTNFEVPGIIIKITSNGWLKIKVNWNLSQISKKYKKYKKLIEKSFYCPSTGLSKHDNFLSLHTSQTLSDKTVDLITLNQRLVEFYLT